MTFQPKTILYIPDVHVKAGDSLARFYSLRHWLADRRIKLDHIIQGGDLWDMEAFCLHDQANPDWYQRNFWDEFQRGFDALDYMEGLVKSFGNNGCKFSLTEGNHENRYNKWMASDNRLATSPFPKTVAEMIAFYRPKSKLNYIPFLQPLIVDDIAFSHYFVSGLMGRATGGERPAANLIKTQLQSSVACHSHVLDFAERTRADGRKIFSLVGGCFVDDPANFAFAGPAAKLWWTGVHLLHINKPGEFDVESVSMSRLLA